MRCGKGHIHASVAEVRNCYSGGTPRSFDPQMLATEPMKNLIRILIETRVFKPEDRDLLDLMGKALSSGEEFDLSVARKFIDRYKPYPQKQPEKRRGSEIKVSRDGIYYDRELNTLYKVQWNQDRTRLFAKVGVEIGGKKLEWDYRPGLIYRLQPEWQLTFEEAKEFGALYGQCIRCGRELSNEKSIEQSMGPICSGRENWR